MTQFYAVQVRTGSENIVAARLEQLKARITTMGIGRIVVPIQTTNNLNLAEQYTSKSCKLLFQNYIFVELHTLTPELFQLIRSVSSSVYTVLSSPIEKSEITHLLEDVVELAVTNESSLSVTIEKMKSLIEENRGADGKRLAIRNDKFNKRSFIKFPIQTFREVVSNLALTVTDLLQSPKRLLEGVFDYETSN